MTPSTHSAALSVDRVRNYRNWCAARVGSLSGAEIGVALADHYLDSLTPSAESVEPPAPAISEERRDRRAELLSIVRYAYATGYRDGNCTDKHDLTETLYANSEIKAANYVDARAENLGHPLAQILDVLDRQSYALERAHKAEAALAASGIEIAQLEDDLQASQSCAPKVESNYHDAERSLAEHVNRQTFIGGTPSQAPTAPKVESWLPTELNQLESFLDGSGTLRGLVFGERPTRASGQFWWRKDMHAVFQHIRAALTKAEPSAGVECKTCNGLPRAYEYNNGHQCPDCTGQPVTGETELLKANTEIARLRAALNTLAALTAGTGKETQR